MIWREIASTTSLMTDKSDSKCTLIPGFFGIFVQGLLFLSCVGILCLKKVREGTRRTWMDFGLDSSKQIFGAGWIHVLNLVSALAFGGMEENGDPCLWYWTGIVLDDTLGTAIAYGIFRMFCRIVFMVHSPQKAREYKTGEYRDPDTGEFILRRYVKQLALWTLVITVMKSTMVFLVFLLRSEAQSAAEWCLSSVIGSPNLELVVVMVLTPFFFNGLQLCLVDQFIRKELPPSEAETSATSLVTPPDCVSVMSSSVEGTIKAGTSPYDASALERAEVSPAVVADAAGSSTGGGGPVATSAGSFPKSLRGSWPSTQQPAPLSTLSQNSQQSGSSRSTTASASALSGQTGEVS